MKRLDEFELFHQRRKRRPLGEIPVAENAPPRSSGGKNPPFGLRPEDPAKKSRNIHNTGNKRTPGLSGSRNDTEFRFSWSDKHGNKENILPPGYKDKSPKTLDNGRAPPLFGQTGQFLKNKRQFSTPKHCISQKDKRSGEMTASSAISITQIRQLASKTKQGETVPPKTEMATCSPNPIPLSMLTSKLWSDSPLPKTPSARYSLLQSLVDYNCTVENSNKEIRTFYDSMRLRELAPVSGPPERSKKGSISIGDPTSRHPVIVVRSTQISPLMTAATTSPQGEILLMHTYETQIGAGSKVILDEFFVYQVAGTPMKAYYNWRLV